MDMKNKIEIVSEAVETVEGAYVPHRIDNAADAYRASLHMVLKHTADVFLTIVDIMAEKYNISQDEIVNTITKHPKYTSTFVNPILHDLGYLNPAAPAPAPAPAPAVAFAPADQQQQAEAQSREAAKARLKEKRKAKEISVSSSEAKKVDELMESMTNMTIDASEVVVAAPAKQGEQEEQQKPKKMIVLKKKKKEAEE
jgi:type IV secretory pathway VirB10-like protein